MTANLARWAILAMASGLCCVSGAAYGQGAQGDNRGATLFDRGRNVSVRERPKPQYEATGVRAGGFRIYPTLTAGLEYNDNIYAAAANEQGDAIVSLTPEIRGETTWSRHHIGFTARADYDNYLEYGAEDQFDEFVGADFRLDFISETALGGGASYTGEHEARTETSSPRAAVEPIEYNLVNLFGTFETQFNRLKLSSRADLRSFDFEDGFTAAGANIEQDDRDRDIFDISVRGDYAVSPATSIFTEAAFNDRNYDLQPPATPITRDSNGYELLAGVNFDLTRLVRGEVAVGWFEQAFDDPAFDNADGFDVRANVEWFPTQLTTVEFGAARNVEDSGIVGSAAYVETSVYVRADHELLRNLILSAELRYSDDDYEGIDRTDERVGVALDATWLLNRSVGIRPFYEYVDQDSSGLFRGADYAVNRFGVSLDIAR